MLTNEQLDKKILESKQFGEKEIKKEEEKIINSKKPGDIYRFAKDVKKGKDIDKLEKAIIAIGDAYYIYYFAKDVKGAHIGKLEDTIIATKNAECIYRFAKEIKKRKDIDKLGDALIEIGNLEYISRFSILGTVNADRIELKMMLRKFDLKLIGEKVGRSFLNKLYFGEKDDTLKYLIKNREIDINEIRLRIYFDYLNNPNSTEEDLEKCNEEYIRYISMFYDEKNKNEEKKENSGKNNEQGKTLVKTKKING